MVFKKIIFQNSLMANETPSRPPPPLHGKCHLKFPFWLLAHLPNLNYDPKIQTWSQARCDIWTSGSPNKGCHGKAGDGNSQKSTNIVDIVTTVNDGRAICGGWSSEIRGRNRLACWRNSCERTKYVILRNMGKILSFIRKKGVELLNQILFLERSCL